MWLLFATAALQQPFLVQSFLAQFFVTKFFLTQSFLAQFFLAQFFLAQFFVTQASALPQPVIVPTNVLAAQVCFAAFAFGPHLQAGMHFAFFEHLQSDPHLQASLHMQAFDESHLQARLHFAFFEHLQSESHLQVSSQPQASAPLASKPTSRPSRSRLLTDPQPGVSANSSSQVVSHESDLHSDLQAALLGEHFLPAFLQS